MTSFLLKREYSEGLRKRIMSFANLDVFYADFRVGKIGSLS